MFKATSIVVLLLGILTLSTGCVRREITIDSEPRGAIVYLNDEQVGRTPVTVDFTWYGVYDLRLEKDGYETIQQNLNVDLPWYEIPPADLIAEAAPVDINSHYRFKFNMKVLDLSDTDVDELIRRGEQLRFELETPEQREARIAEELRLIEEREAKGQATTQPSTSPTTTPGE